MHIICNLQTSSEIVRLYYRSKMRTTGGSRQLSQGKIEKSSQKTKIEEIAKSFESRLGSAQQKGGGRDGGPRPGGASASASASTSVAGRPTAT
mmetsp:Transcript_29843/g.44336  ORF Transcript_29843/g.44336 Transcript_29843/m.44336 type:complete len:93 (-) Transcript_29843:54-332(-)